MTNYEKCSSSFLFKLATYPKMEKIHNPNSIIPHTYVRQTLPWTYTPKIMFGFHIFFSQFPPWHVFSYISFIFYKDTRSKTVPALHFTKWVEVLFLMSIFIFMQMWVFKRNLLNNSYVKSFYERLKIACIKFSFKTHFIPL